MTTTARPGGLVVPSAAAPDGEGRVAHITPEIAGWRYVGFEAFRLRQGQRLERPADQQEVCVVLLAGQCRASAGGREWPSVGGRAGVFEGRPHALYVPAGSSFELEATTPTLEIAVGMAPVAEPAAGRQPRVIAPDDVRVSTRGEGFTERTIHDILMADQPADSLLVTEVLTPGGHWSSYPPHKHDTDDPPRETYLEELYYHRLRRPDGWAVQRVYTRDGSLDETVCVGDGDCVLVPRGYHPVSAAPGFDLYYLNFMAGPVRQWLVTFDPEVVAACV